MPYFKPILTIEEGLTDPVDPKAIAATPCLLSAKMDFALNNARGALQTALRCILNNPFFSQKYKENPENIFIDSWVTSTKNGQVPSPYGLHTDGARKTHSGQPDLESLGKNDDSWSFLIILGDSEGESRPLFITETLEVNAENLDPKNVWQSLHRAVFPNLTQIKSTTLQYGKLAVYNGNTLHTAQSTTLTGETPHLRGLIRASYLPYGYPHLNQLRKQDEIKIYYPSFS